MEIRTAKLLFILDGGPLMTYQLVEMLDGEWLDTSSTLDMT